MVTRVFKLAAILAVSLATCSPLHAQLFLQQFAEISVKDPTSGAVGDNSNDDTAEIQTAIDAVASAGGGVVIFPSGTYKVTSSLVLKEQVSLRGPMNGSGDASPATINFVPAAADDLFDATASPLSGSYAEHGSISGLRITGDGTANSRYAFDYLAPSGVEIRNVRVSGFDHAIRMRDGERCEIAKVHVTATSSIAGSSAILLDTQVSQTGAGLVIRDCTFTAGDWGLIATADAYDDVSVVNTTVSATQKGVAQVEEGCESWQFANIHAPGCGTDDDGTAYFQLGTAGSGSAAAAVRLRDLWLTGSTVGASRVAFDVGRADVMVANAYLDNMNGGAIDTASDTVHVSLVDVHMADSSVPIYGSIDDFEEVTVTTSGLPSAGLQTHGLGFVVNVQDYGAKGDGVTDDTTAINLAVDRVEATSGGTVFFPAGVYILSAPITVASNYTQLRGEGPESFIRQTGSGNTIEVENAEWGHVNSLSIQGDGANGVGLKFNNTSHHWMVDAVQFINNGSHGAQVAAVGEGHKFTSCWFIGNGGSGIHAVSDGSNQNGNGLSVVNCRFSGNTGDGITWNASGLNVTGSFFSGNTGAGVEIDASTAGASEGVHLSGNSFEDNVAGQVLLTSRAVADVISDVSLSGNYIESSASGGATALIVANGSSTGEVRGLSLLDNHMEFSGGTLTDYVDLNNHAHFTLIRTSLPITSDFVDLGSEYRFDLYRPLDFVVTPEEYGADGTDSSEDTAAFQLALDALEAAGGGTLLLADNATYLLDQATVTSNITIRGQGDSTVIKRKDAGTDLAWALRCQAADTVSNVLLANFKFDGNEANQTSGFYTGCFRADSATKLEFAGLTVINGADRAFDLRACSEIKFFGVHATDCGVAIPGGNFGNVISCDIDGDGVGCTDIQIAQCHFTTFGDAAIGTPSCKRVSIVGCILRGATDVGGSPATTEGGIACNGCEDLTISSCEIRKCKNDGIRIDDISQGGANFTADDTTDVITSSAHPLSDGDRITVSSATTLPAGLSAAQQYFVRDSTTNTFKVSLTSGGSAVDITSTGTGTHSWAHYYPIQRATLTGNLVVSGAGLNSRIRVFADTNGDNRTIAVTGNVVDLTDCVTTGPGAIAYSCGGYISGMVLTGNAARVDSQISDQVGMNASGTSGSFTRYTIASNSFTNFGRGLQLQDGVSAEGSVFPNSYFNCAIDFNRQITDNGGYLTPDAVFGGDLIVGGSDNAPTGGSGAGTISMIGQVTAPTPGSGTASLYSLPDPSGTEHAYVVAEDGQRLTLSGHKVNATTAPTRDSDVTDGFEAGSLWVDVTNRRAYRCVDATDGNAVWIEAGSKPSLNTIDTFTDTNSTDLESHNPDFSVSPFPWISDGTTTGFTITSNRAVAKTTTAAEPFNRVKMSVGASDFHATGIVRVVSDATDDARFGFRFGEEDATDPTYYFWYLSPNADDFDLFYFNGSGNTSLDTSSPSIDVDTDYRWHVDVHGDQCRVWLDGVDGAGLQAQIPNNLTNTQIALISKFDGASFDSIEVYPYKTLGFEKETTTHRLVSSHHIEVTNADAIGIADFDEDGDEDIVYSEQAGGTFWLERGRDFHHWTRHTIRASGNVKVEGVTAASFDGENVQAVSVDQTQDQVLLHTQDTPGSPTSTWTTTALVSSRDSIHDVIAVDIDSDGLPEIVYAWEGVSNGTGGVNWVDYDGGDISNPANWTDRVIRQHDGAWWVNVGDFSGNGHGMDIVFGSRLHDNPDPEEGIYIVDRPGTVTTTPWSTVTNVETNAEDWLQVSTGNLFGNGSKLDIVSHDNNGTYNTVIYDASNSYASTAFLDHQQGSNLTWNAQAIDLGSARSAVLQIVQNQGYYLDEWDGSQWVGTRLEWVDNISHPGDGRVHVIHGDPGRKAIVFGDSNANRILLFELEEKASSVIERVGAITLAASATTFSVDRSLIVLTGDGGGNTVATITGTNAYAGSRLTIVCTDANVTITDTDAHTANTIDLTGTATNFSSADDKTLELVHDGTSWYQVGGSAN